MNIDLRNVSERFEENVTKIKQLKGYKTNTTAVEHCVNNFLRVEEEKEELKKELEIAKRSRDRYKSKILNFKEVFENLME